MTHSPQPLTGAELQTLREACNLSRDELGQLAGVQARTIKHWETGRAGIPIDVASLVQRLDASAAQAVQQAVQTCAYSKSVHDEPPAEIVLLRYQTDADLAHYRPDMARFPASLHGAIIGRVRVAIAALPGFATVKIRVVWMLPDQYEPWRSVSQMPDTESTRAQWAAEQVSLQSPAHKGDQPPV